MIGLLTAFVAFAASAAVIYVACIYFVNAVEWLGRSWRLSETATGTVLAAFGTALPETVVTFFAVVVGRSAADHDIGVGAALGGPLVLATLAYPLAGAAMLAAQRGRGQPDAEVAVEASLRRDQRLFLAIFAVKLLLGVVQFTGKRWLGPLFFLAYAFFVREEIRRQPAVEAGELVPLRFFPRGVPSLAQILLQVAVAATLIGLASHFFVHQLELVGTRLGVAPQLISLLLSPVATELPEVLNAFIWIRQGKEGLALANISGAMMIQATLPTGLSVLFTPWHFDPITLIAGAVTAVAMAVLLLLFNRSRVDVRWLLPLTALYVLFGLAAALLSI